MTRLPAFLYVFTYREGLLSRLGHDLRLSFDRFTIRSEQGVVAAQVELGSLQVDGAMHDGRLDAQQLDAGDRAKIVASATGDVLAVQRFAEASFQGKASVHDSTDSTLARITGTLSLHGSERPLELAVEQAGRELVVGATLTPSAFGIAPFRTLAGAIRVQDRLRIELRATLPEGQGVKELAAGTLEIVPSHRFEQLAQG